MIELVNYWSFFMILWWISSNDLLKNILPLNSIQSKFSDLDLNITIFNIGVKSACPSFIVEHSKQFNFNMKSNCVLPLPRAIPRAITTATCRMMEGCYVPPLAKCDLLSSSWLQISRPQMGARGVIKTSLMSP